MSKVAVGMTLVALTLVCLGCTARYPTPVTASYDSLMGYDADGISQGSLFKGDSEILSDDDIARILGFKLELADSNRLAVLKLGVTQYWSEEHAKIDQANVAAFLDQLRSAAPVVDAGQLPRLLVPEKTTVPYLREAAARYQADLLLIYDTAVRTFTKYRTLGKDEVRALCAVDAILLDVRTGIVPFTSRKTEEVVVTRSSDDLNFSETTARAVSTAEGRALEEIAAATVAFINGAR